MRRLTLLLFVAITFAGCDEDLTLLDQDIELSKDFDVSVPATGPNSISMEKTINAADEPTLDAYIDRIEGIEINALTYSISNYEADEAVILENASIVIESGEGIELATVELPNINLSTMNNAEDQPLDLTEAEIQTIQETFDEEQRIDFTVSGSVDKVPVDFTFTINMDITIQYRIAETQ